MNLLIKQKLESFKRILVTGGAGFIGGTLVRTLLKETDVMVYNFDKMGYASDCTGIKELINDSNNEKARLLSSKYKFFAGDLKNKSHIEEIFDIAKPNLVFHLAAESHVDRSIDNPFSFIESNVIVTYI